MSKNTYDDEFKKSIVKMYMSGKSVTDLSKEHNLSKAGIYKWIDKYSNNTDRIKDTELPNLILIENIRLKEEIEILKKALLIISTK